MEPKPPLCAQDQPTHPHCDWFIWLGRPEWVQFEAGKLMQGRRSFRDQVACSQALYRWALARSLDSPACRRGRPPRPR